MIQEGAPPLRPRGENAYRILHAHGARAGENSSPCGGRGASFLERSTVGVSFRSLINQGIINQRMNSIRTLFIIVALVFVCNNVFAEEDYFPTPDILKNNVAFWKKIYTEVSLKEGLLHDRDYPQIIYEKIFIGDKSGRSLSAFIDGRKEYYGVMFRNIAAGTVPLSPEEQRIAELFKAAGFDSVTVVGAGERIRFQLGQMERYRQGLERSTLYLDTIRVILAQYGVPQRLAFLPHVESSFDAEAYSKVGAAGLWQFMRETGRSYLKINYLVDERRDPILATVAAAKLLSYNYREIKSWPLAITAYNHGLQGMKNAVAKCGTRDIGTIIQKHESPSFKFASKNFYSCFLAASEIAANPDAYFSNLTSKPRRQHADMVLTHFMRPATISQYLKISLEELERLNPALRPVVFSQQKMIPAGYVLRIPPGVAVTDAQMALTAVPDSLQSDQPEVSHYYPVESGDNLNAIAERLGVSVVALAEENAITKAHRIFKGQVLRVPERKPLAVEVATVMPSSEQTPPAAAVVVPEPVRTPEPPKPMSPAKIESSKVVAAAKPVVPQRAPAIVPKVADSLREVFSAVAVSVSPPSPQAVPAAITTEFDVELYNLEVVLGPTGNTATISVSVDETIGHFAEWLGVPAQRIRLLNHLSAGSVIQVKRKIVVPVDNITLDKFVQTRLEYHMALEEDFYSQYKVVDMRSKLITSGDNLWNLCTTEEIPLWLFYKYNSRIDLSALQPGMPVWIPVVGGVSDPVNPFIETIRGKSAPSIYEGTRQRYNRPLRRVP